MIDTILENEIARIWIKKPHNCLEEDSHPEEWIFSTCFCTNNRERESIFPIIVILWCSNISLSINLSEKSSDVGRLRRFPYCSCNADDVRPMSFDDKFRKKSKEYEEQGLHSMQYKKKLAKSKGINIVPYILFVKMKRLQEIPLPQKRWSINISQVRDLRSLMWKKVDYIFLPGNSELIGKNRRASHPVWIFLDNDAIDDSKADQVVTFYPQGVSRKDVFVNGVLIDCDAAGNIALPENIKIITQDTNIRVTSFLLIKPFPYSCLWFAMLGMQKNE
jgi:hypothetical protein